jgi:hypothetical protein
MTKKSDSPQKVLILSVFKHLGIGVYKWIQSFKQHKTYKKTYRLDKQVVRLPL